tara:strand:+ start:2413 stop:2991 length:579 start_codon:yes stop_codon:yes gene_type:complete
MSNSYVLVNPHIEGSLKTQVKAKNSLEAAKNLYKNLSEHFNNNVPKFHFTIQKGNSGNGKFYSFKVKESRTDNTVDFSLEPVVVQNEKNTYVKFKKNLMRFTSGLEQKGGAKKNRKPNKSKKSDPFDDDEDDEDFFDSDTKKGKSTHSYYTPNVYSPISHFYYDPYLYSMNTFYVPTFYSYLNPFIHINFIP